MADNGKMMRSIRANPAVFERLAAVARDGGLDQGAALEALLNAWDVQQARNEVPERAADVADFDAHLQGIQSAFLRSLELAQNAEARARQDFRAQVESQTAMLSRQADEIQRLTAERDKLAAERDALAAEARELRKRDRLAGLLESMAARLEGPEDRPATRRARKARATEAAPEVAAEGVAE